MRILFLLLVIPPLHYFNFAQARHISSFICGGDSVVFSKYSDAAVSNEPRRCFRLLETQQHGNYWWLYVAGQSNVRPLTNPPSIDSSIGMVVLYTSEDQQRLFIRFEAMGFKTLAECESATAHFDAAGKFFNTWYSSSYLQECKSYPDLKAADSTTVAAVADEWVKTLTAQQRSGMTHVNLNDPAGNRINDVLTTILIRHHFDPTSGIDGLNGKLRQYHISLPRVPVYRTTPVRPLADTGHLRAPVIGTAH
jgi:hypothetical protein